MIVFPNCKINLGLRITGKRPDGYHNIETVFYPVPLIDALEIVEDQRPVSPEPHYSGTGIPIPGDYSANLCVKAYQLLKKNFPELPAVKMHLHKVIPMGAGLGGGSSDGAFALRLLNDLFELGLSDQELIDYALQLGSDCPFFIMNTPCFATGRGELLNPVNLSLKGYHILLVNPGIHISTKEAFAGIRIQPKPTDLHTIVRLPVSEWKNFLNNDFEPVIFKLYPALAAIKSSLYEAGASYACMTGTGSTFFGLFENQPPTIAGFEGYFTRSILLG